MAFRHTPQRRLILRTVKLHGGFLTAEDVHRTVKQQDRGIGVATVYRNLDLLCARGEIFAFEGEDGIRRFAGSVFHNATFTCQHCGKKFPVPLKHFQRQLQKALPMETIFFSRLDVRGLCPDHTKQMEV